MVDQIGGEGCNLKGTLQEPREQCGRHSLQERSRSWRPASFDKRCNYDVGGPDESIWEGAAAGRRVEMGYGSIGFFEESRGCWEDSSSSREECKLRIAC